MGVRSNYKTLQLLYYGFMLQSSHHMGSCRTKLEKIADPLKCLSDTSDIVFSVWLCHKATFKPVVSLVVSLCFTSRFRLAAPLVFAMPL